MDASAGANRASFIRQKLKTAAGLRIMETKEECGRTGLHFGTNWLIAAWTVPCIRPQTSTKDFPARALRVVNFYNKTKGA